MTHGNTRSNRHPYVYESVKLSETELVLQPACSRARVMRKAWLSMLLFEIVILPLMMLATFGVNIIVFASLKSIMPVFENTLLTHICILLPWVILAAAMVFLTWRMVWESGYTTFIFDRLQQQLIINTANLVGGKLVQIVPFDRIEDAQFEEYIDDGVMHINIFLLIPKKPPKIATDRQHRFNLSSMNTDDYPSVDSITTKQEHQRLLLQVRSILGLSIEAISQQISQHRTIPTEAEIQQEKERASVAARESLVELTKTIFSSKQQKQERLKVLRELTLQSPEDPKIWEELGLLLAMQKNPSISEIIAAYRQAEALYLDREDTENAIKIAKIIHNLN
ncbi:hypothetical protein [Chamaesiphon polymorphus]|uniref:Uncharacterized protein n=1 Tax=Chamaesiphon polymorphus CCALA 037 TaxID=2107692 RepID=A0A2T1FYZ4_9CYAN|nr:hypothetical protein [Chamaesiphon polymorphus]PSB50146.1 hypothetical protein C7B77_23110 [Chamaesiphon polymorphus CCALA 037]